VLKAGGFCNQPAFASLLMSYLETTLIGCALHTPLQLEDLCWNAAQMHAG
jgi:hypothetical protein